jgi:hypothetical protein
MSSVHREVCLMSRARRRLLWLSIAAAFATSQAQAQSQPLLDGVPGTPPGFVLPFDKSAPAPSGAAPASQVVYRTPSSSDVPLDQLPERVREQVRAVIEQPTISGCGPAENFPGRIEGYRWLLDHPDRVAQAWIRLRVPCLTITSPSDNHFRWVEPHGSDLAWETIQRTPDSRIWYAEGHVRPGRLCPPVPVRAVLVMHFRDERDWLGHPHVEHHADLFLQTDSAAASMVLRLLGPSIPNMTEQCLGQLEMFFSGMSTYLHRHPDQAAALLAKTPNGAP